MAKLQIQKLNGSPARELPEDWALSHLADIATDIQPGFACGRHTDSAGGVAQLRPMNVSRAGKIDLERLVYVPKTEVSRDERWLSLGDIVFNNTNSAELVGKTACYDLPERRAFSNHMTRIRCDARAADPRFCALALHQKWLEGHFESICNNHVSQASVGRKALLETLIPLPPLAEQKRIVAKIDALIARVDAARARLAKVPAMLKRFRQSVLVAACSGGLTADWREEHREIESSEELLRRIVASRQITRRPRGNVDQAESSADIDIPDSWGWSSVGSLANVQGGIQKTPLRAPRKNFRPYLRVANVLRGSLDLNEVFNFELAAGELEKWRLEPGDLLVVEGNGSVSEIGRCALWRGEIADCVHQNHIIRVRLPRNLWHPAFTVYYLNSPLGIAEMVRVSTSTSGLNTLSVSKVESILVPVAPLEEQREIVRRVEALFELADAIEKRVAMVTARGEKLTQSILAKAFRGELVPTEAELARDEGRQAEPATALLARLATEQQQNNGASKQQTRRGKNIEKHAAVSGRIR